MEVYEKIEVRVKRLKYAKDIETGEVFEIARDGSLERLEDIMGDYLIQKREGGGMYKFARLFSGGYDIEFADDPTKEEIRALKLSDLNQPKIAVAMDEVMDELKKVKEKYPLDFNSLHEGYAVAKEEVDELWDEIKAKNPDREKIRTEAMQCAAMFIRIMSEMT